MHQSIINDPKSWGKRNRKVEEIKADLTAKLKAWVDDYFASNNIEDKIGHGLTLQVTMTVEL